MLVSYNERLTYIATVVIRLEVPREPYEESCVRPFDIIASDVDVLFEVKPEGKVSRRFTSRTKDAITDLENSLQDQTVVTVGVNKLDIVETSKDDVPLKFLGITQSRTQVG